MRAIVLALALALSAPVAANEETCDSFADVVFTLATHRDDGMSRREMRSRVIQRVDEKVRDAFLLLTDFVFKRPYLTPDEEARAFYKDCLKELSGTRTGFNF